MKRLLAIAAVVALTGCGYHTAGRGSKLPQAVHTIAVPAFVNQTHTYRIEQALTGAVIREFHTRTKYAIATQAGPDADATLHGTVLSIGTAPVTFDSQTGRASTMLVTINLRVDLVDRS